LLDEHYLEKEVRIEYLTGLPPGAEPDLSALHPHTRALRRLEQARRAGWTTFGRQNLIPAYAAMGRPQLEYSRARLTRVECSHVPGDWPRIGVGRGGGAKYSCAAFWKPISYRTVRCGS